MLYLANVLDLHDWRFVRSRNIMVRICSSRHSDLEYLLDVDAVNSDCSAACILKLNSAPQFCILGMGMPYLHCRGSGGLSYDWVECGGGCAGSATAESCCKFPINVKVELVASTRNGRLRHFCR